MEDFANHYGTVVVPARASKPRDKSAVENHVKIIYTQVFARLRHRRFFDLASLNEAIMECVAKLNQTRMQNRTYSREERFISSEKHLLGELPADPFLMKYYAALKVAENGHVFLGRDRHFYSVPHPYRGLKAQVIYTDQMVCIYVQNKQVAVHKRSLRAHGYSTDPGHLASTHREYSRRSPEHYRQRASALSIDFGRLVDLVFSQSKKYPEQLYRTCDGLFRLQRTYGAPLFDKACRIALNNGIVSYKFLENMLSSGMVEWQHQDVQKDMPRHGNIRGSGYYS